MKATTLRNDKSSRYKFFVDNVLLPERTNRDVKVLHLSVTLINNKLMDIRNQFKLMTKGKTTVLKKPIWKLTALKTFSELQKKRF